MALNQVTLMGRLTAAPELRQTQQGTSVTSFTLAVDRDYQQNQVDFIPCVAWRKTAEFAAKWFGKGAPAAVVGQLQIRKYTDRDGNNRTAAEVIVSSMYFAGPKGGGAEDGVAEDGGKTGELSTADFTPATDDDDLPF
jgi:single-strand DNA-binding protein